MKMNDKTTVARKHLLAEVESVKSRIALTPEERKKEVRRRMYVEQRALEMERRQRVVLESKEKSERDRVERERVKESLRRQREKVEEEKMKLEALEKQKRDQLEQERLRWKKMMMVEDVPEPWKASTALRQEQAWKQETLGHLSTVRDEASPKSLTSDLKSAEIKKQPLYNNWVEEEKIPPYHLFAAKPGLKPEGNPKASQASETVQWMQDRLKVGRWVDKYRDHKERKDEKRRRKAEESYARWTAFKTSRASQRSLLNDCYTGGFAIKKNSILKSTF